MQSSEEAPFLELKEERVVLWKRCRPLPASMAHGVSFSAQGYATDCSKQRKQHEYSGPSCVNTADISTHATAQKHGEPVPLKSFSTTVPTRVLAEDRQFGVNGPTCTSRQGDVSRDVCSQRIWNYIKLRERSQCAGQEFYHQEVRRGIRVLRKFETLFFTSIRQLKCHPLCKKAGEITSAKEENQASDLH
ncbi:hypothetical protein MJG53_012706 [Ovis ammon polii x Ovis aries]|uniref:Uncharacterized protein n=2 Tax=Ovis TaxID=9935 RepID=A0AAD4TWZ7_OVIAM|nr:hypothetical protein MG293_014689 [Ovis ammon polii]KAI4572868.1 hypothetical protein MJG53_012706 [Ovis ammon polii x Ovis aries]